MKQAQERLVKIGQITVHLTAISKQTIQAHRFQVLSSIISPSFRPLLFYLALGVNETLCQHKKMSLYNILIVPWEENVDNDDDEEKESAIKVISCTTKTFAHFRPVINT